MEPYASALGPHQRHPDHHHHHAKGRRCGARTRLLAVLALAAVAGCTTIALQLLASNLSSWPGSGHKAKGAMPAEFVVAPSSAVVAPLPPPRPPARSRTTSLEPGEGKQPAEGTEARPYGDADLSMVVPGFQQGRRRPLVVDRRFTGQRTGRPPNLEEEVPPYRPPASPEGPFGWGTDWVAGVGTPGSGGRHAEDVIEPASCYSSTGNRGFTEGVMSRRVRRHLNADALDRVVSCTRTKDRGRYLPEWVAYHWAMGVDEMNIYDDDSVDDTREVLEPFIRAGIVKFQPRHIDPRNATATTPSAAMQPALTACVESYRGMHDVGDRLAPRWVVLVDADEFLWARAAGEIGLPDALEARSTTCCLKVSTVQHGTSGFSKSPRGLLLENFLTHADPASPELNGPPKVSKVVLKLRNGANGTASASSSEDINLPVSSVGGGVMEMGEGCRCEEADVADLAIRRYPLTREDVAAKERRYDTLLQWQQQQQERRAMTRREVIEFDESLETAALNDHKSEGVLEWSCVVRRLLDRAANGKNVVTGRPQASLSPHHPVSHGARAMDPYGAEESQRTEACMSAVRASPASTMDTAWGSPGSSSSPDWLQHLCSTRYVFVHSFENTGEAAVMRSLSSHPWVRLHGVHGVHGGQEAVDGGGGSSLTSVFSSPQEREGMTETALSELCGCSEGGSSPAGCGRYCPDLQRRLLAPEEINGARRQLVQDWLLRFDLKPKKPAVVLVERDTDMLVASKQGLFPFVSTSLLTVRHPICTTTLGRHGDTDGKCDGDVGCGAAAGLREWREVWRQVLIEQVPRTVNGSIWVVRFEDLLSQEQDAASALWAAVGLPPISPYLPPATTKPAVIPIPISKKNRRGQQQRPRRLQHQPLPQQEQQQRQLDRRRRRRLIMGDAMSRASPAVRNAAVPSECRLRMVACEEDPGCRLELLRSASLLDFFGYGGVGELLNSQRFLWGKEELEWLGERLAAEPSELLDVLNERENGGRLRLRFRFDSDDEPSVILPQPPPA